MNLICTFNKLVNYLIAMHNKLGFCRFIIDTRVDILLYLRTPLSIITCGGG